MISTKSLLALVPFVAGAFAQSKQVISPELRRDQIYNPIMNYMPPTQSHWDQWGAGWTLEDCYNFARERGQNPADYEVFNVHYTDCSEPWIMCRHRSAKVDQIRMIDMIGRLPVRVRQHIKHFIVSYDIGPYAGLYWGGNIAIDDESLDMYVLMHEASHALDFSALRQYGSPFSETAIWKDNWAQDSRIPTGYAAGNWVENFAESGPIGLYDRYVPGGIGNIQPNWSQIFHQYATYQGYLGDTIQYGGTCPSRIPNSKVVSMYGRSAKVSTAAMGEMPDVSFKSANVTVLEEVVGSVSCDKSHFH
ncbi:uncharacterized protein B0I36DRAFT_394517 [Microdochium trichocladiopsis]|uniref:Conidiation-specific protein n=1 Tax=Microdochium trichocladiopsis TaxID=1682393 RepID=A0A9P8XTT6_9PEZI|nr:uncharacterized protein B0I36DRAFT_394517 [Microdochium trichocladiopsis]KAH7017978.1 hypothetical protein B0I36DRAFT_394517 [Microdochium trichocladiopsis]